MDPTKIHSIDLLKCDVWEFPDKTSLKIEAIGCTSSGGWTNPELVPVEDDDCPPGYYALGFIATPPTEPSTQVETPIKATHMIEKIPDDLVGIKVIAETNSKQKRVVAGDDEGENDPKPTWGGKKGKKKKKWGKKHDSGHGSGKEHGGWRKKRKPWDDPHPDPHDPTDPEAPPCGCGAACREGEVECLVGVDVWDEWITIYVYSNGHTKKEHFKWCLFKGCADTQPYLLEFCRCKPDDHECEEPEVVPIKFTCEELCLEPGDKFVIRNPFCCEPPETDPEH